ncbi:unnamed protein product [Linum trigynum]|uniref:Uncharacterized protein n=1 Tax=Linum trigynum TaxID=586398 RepID=A0AAV2F466_9ROSI
MSLKEKDKPHQLVKLWKEVQAEERSNRKKTLEVKQLEQQAEKDEQVEKQAEILTKELLVIKFNDSTVEKAVEKKQGDESKVGHQSPTGKQNSD